MSYEFPDGFVQVLNLKTGMVHLSNGAGVACNAWRPGTPEAPSKNAEWAKSSSQRDSQVNPYEFCLNCHSSKALTKLGGGKLKVAGKALSDDESSSSESGSGESSDSSSSSS